MLLQLQLSQIPATFQKGYGFGYIIASIIVDLFMLTRAARIPQKYHRWSNYQEPSVPTRARWQEMCHAIAVYACMSLPPTQSRLQ
jgi:hypothetical protein